MLVMRSWLQYVTIRTGWWFQTCFMFHNILAILGIIIPTDFHSFQYG